MTAKVILTAANAALHYVAVAVTWVARSLPTFAALALPLASASKVGAALPAEAAFDVTAYLAWSFGDLPAPSTFVLTVCPVCCFQSLGFRQGGNGRVYVEVLLSTVV